MALNPALSEKDKGVFVHDISSTFDIKKSRTLKPLFGRSNDRGKIIFTTPTSPSI